MSGTLKSNPLLGILAAGLLLGRSATDTPEISYFRPRGGVKPYRQKCIVKKLPTAGTKIAREAEAAMCGCRGRKPGIVQQAFHEINARKFREQKKS